MIECRGISVQVGKKTLLDGVSWKVVPGAINAILGANGAGKSTLFKVVLGLFKAEHGTVIFDGKAHFSWTHSELASRRAYMAQAQRIPMSLPLYEYLSLARLHCVEPNAHTDKVVETVLSLLDLNDFSLAHIDRLSGGEWQRAELARAYCQLYHQGRFENTILMLDEPAAALDINQTQKLYHYLKHYVNLGGTVAIIEHDINTAARYCDYLLLMKQAKVLEQGATELVFNSKVINSCFNVTGEVVTSQYHQRPSFII